MNGTRHAAIAGILVMAISAPTIAGVANSPLPLLDNKKAKLVYTVPGVISSAALATAITCTSLEKSKDIRFSVEYFAAAGGPPENVIGIGTGLEPGETKTVSTEGTTLAESTFDLPDSDSARSARIVATSTKLGCTATVLQRTGNGAVPESGWSLTILKKTKQSGD